MFLCDNVKIDSPRKMKKKIRKEKARQYYIQVTLDGSNFDLLKFSISQSKPVVHFFTL